MRCAMASVLIAMVGLLTGCGGGSDYLVETGRYWDCTDCGGYLLSDWYYPAEYVAYDVASYYGDAWWDDSVYVDDWYDPYWDDAYYYEDAWYDDWWYYDDWSYYDDWWYYADWAYYDDWWY